jgi:predicted ATP-dependent protease
VPLGEEDPARARAGDKIQVVPVSTFDEAIDFMAGLGGNGKELREQVQAKAQQPAPVPAR